VRTGVPAGTILPATRPVQKNAPGLDRLPTKAGSPASAPQRITHDVFHSDPTRALFLSSADAAGRTAEKTGREQAARELTAPVTGTITSSYGWRNDPFTKKTAWHAGIDVAASSGAPVAACWDGQVVFAGWKGGYGNTVILEHQGGWRSVYGHLSAIDVASGDSVAAGRKIAEVGSTGRSTGPHLHFELRYADASVDPLSAGVWTAESAPSGQPARQPRHIEGGGHDLANHRESGQAGKGLVASGRVAEGRIYPPEGLDPAQVAGLEFSIHELMRQIMRERLELRGLYAALSPQAIRLREVLDHFSESDRETADSLVASIDRIEQACARQPTRTTAWPWGCITRAVRPSSSSRTSSPRKKPSIPPRAASPRPPWDRLF
jgi:hypothetical protein